jgi:hypothetical protein
LLELGLQVPEVYGDPAILLSLIQPGIAPMGAVGKVGIIPHLADLKRAASLLGDKAALQVIDLSGGIESVLGNLTCCQCVFSSSLHGIIVAQAYGIPALWFKYGDIGGDDVKFDDYFLSVGIAPYPPFKLSVGACDPDGLLQMVASNHGLALCARGVLDRLRLGLLRSFPLPLNALGMALVEHLSEDEGHA